MPIERGQTSIFLDSTAALTSASFSHSVGVSTDVLIVAAIAQADESQTGSPEWSQGGGESLTLIANTTASGLTGDQRAWLWALVDPTSGSGSVQGFQFNSASVGATYVGIVAINYKGCNHATEASAVSLIESVVNDAAASNTQFSNATVTPGNALGIIATGRGADMAPASAVASFATIYNQETGGGSSTTDGALYYGDQLTASASAQPNVIWNTSDENAGLFFEIVAATSAAAGGAAKTVLFRRIRGA